MMMGMMDIVADTIMIVEAKKDPYFGVESLKSLSHMTDIIGKVLGTFLSGYLNKVNPQLCFIINSVCGLIVLTISVFLPKSIDAAGIDHMQGFCVELRKTGEQIKYII
jgi:hypothetical protein